MQMAISAEKKDLLYSLVVFMYTRFQQRVNKVTNGQPNDGQRSTPDARPHGQRSTVNPTTVPGIVLLATVTRPPAGNFPPSFERKKYPVQISGHRRFRTLLNDKPPPVNPTAPSNVPCQNLSPAANFAAETRSNHCATHREDASSMGLVRDSFAI